MLMSPVSAGGFGKQLVAIRANRIQATVKKATLWNVVFLKRTKDLLLRPAPGLPTTKLSSGECFVYTIYWAAVERFCGKDSVATGSLLLILN